MITTINRLASEALKRLYVEMKMHQLDYVGRVKMLVYDVDGEVIEQWATQVNPDKRKLDEAAVDKGRKPTIGRVVWFCAGPTLRFPAIITAIGSFHDASDSYPLDLCVFHPDSGPLTMVNVNHGDLQGCWCWPDRS